MSDWQVEQQMTEIEQLKRQLATVTEERDAWQRGHDAAVRVGLEYQRQLAEAIADRADSLTQARQAVWEEAIFFVDHHSNDEDLIQALTIIAMIREQAKKEVQP